MHYCEHPGCESTDLLYDQFTGDSKCEQHLSKAPDNAMTVREVIVYLTQFSPDTEVVLVDSGAVEALSFEQTEDNQYVIAFPV